MNMKTVSVMTVSMVIFVCLMKIAKALRCYECVNAASESECSWKTRTCEVDQEMCYTEIRNYGDRVSITKSCYQGKACAILASQNSHECPRVCSLCCEGNLCNKKGPSACGCNLVSVSQLPTTTVPRTTRRKRKKPTRRTPTRTRTTKRPKTCEESSFVPIPETSGHLECGTAEKSDYNICSLSSEQVINKGLIRYLHLSISDQSTSFKTYHQCRYSIDGASLSTTSEDFDDPNKPINLVCINMTSSEISVPADANIKKSAETKSDENQEKQFECFVDDMSVMTMFNESMLHDYGSAENVDHAETENLKAIMELRKICQSRIFSVQCYIAQKPPTTILVTTQKLTTKPNETTIYVSSTVQATTQVNQTSAVAITAKIQAAAVPTWGISMIAVGGALLGIFLLVVLLRQCGKSGFYRIHMRKKKKVSPKHKVNA
uniref:uncharacterized protein LOC120343346 n=1 Tax=Styela clava TaxID=7725 RepID=UPI00193A8F7E|nr:uncharacterized protein LOC120343346 [Styela clava]